jgi:lysophospholipase L1-like esterase
MLDVIREHIEKGKIYRIVFFGDSLVAADSVHPNWTDIVNYVLKNELKMLMGDWRPPYQKVKCINSGIDGSNTEDWLEELDRLVFFYKPNLVISLLGINDYAIHQFTTQRHKGAVEELARLVAGSVDNYFYCTSIPANNEGWQIKYREYVEVVKKIELPDDVALVDVFNKFLNFDLDKLFTFVSEEGYEDVGLDIKPGDIDYFHPNQLGHAYIAKVILKEIFNVEFDPEKYMTDTLAGKMYPDY